MGGLQNLKSLGNSVALADIANRLVNDFFHTTTVIWPYRNISSGTNALTTALGHPGVVSYSSSTSANSGSGVGIDACLQISGGEKSTIIFKTATTLTGVTRRMGFSTSISEALPTDGCYGMIADGVLTGITANNNTRSTTATSFTLSANTWYRLKISINSNATLVTYTLYTDNSDTVLWTDTLATNIPASNRAVGHGDIATYSGTSAIVIGYIDYIDVEFSNVRRIV